MSLTSGLELQARREAKAAKEQAALAAKALAELQAALAEERDAKVTLVIIPSCQLLAVAA